jgi:hypothetical protein
MCAVIGNAGEPVEAGPHHQKGLLFHLSADLLDLPFVARQLFVEYLEKIHGCMVRNNRKLCRKILSFFLPGRKYKR